MSTNTGISTPTITAQQWSNIQIMQTKARVFLSAATGSAAKSNLMDFQRAFNAAYEGILVSVAASGGDPAAVSRLIGGTSVAVDGLWGPQTALAMSVVLWVSFPSNVWSAASVELSTSAVINKTSGATPLSRNLIASQWYPKWKNQVQAMVWKDYAGAVIQAQKPDTTQNSETTVIKEAKPSASTVEQQIDKAKEPVQGDVQIVPGDVAGAKSMTWLWVTLGFGAVGGGLWWMYGRKAR